MFLPEFWPAYYDKANGCEVWDLDGNKYIDMSYMGIGSCILGYADKTVNSAVIKSINNGSMCTLNAPEEVELARLLIKIHPWADMVRYARSGGEAMSIAIRIARAKTGRDKVLFCGYHGWHDWYLSSNIANKKSLNGHLLPGLNPLGVPRGLRGTSFPFYYNDKKAFLKLIKQHKNEIGAVVVEPIRNHYPQKGFLETIRKVTRQLDIVFIIDEITAGWRMTVGGAHLLFNMKPDIAVFAKGISNGFPLAAILGKKEVMAIAQDTFISSTNWTERVGPVAALATINKIKRLNVPAYLSKIGKEVQKGWKKSAAMHGLDIEVGGTFPLGHFSFKHGKTLVIKTLFTQLMLEKGFLATTAFYASYAHKHAHIRRYLKAVDESFSLIGRAIHNGNPESYLKGPICHSGFKRLT